MRTRSILMLSIIVAAVIAGILACGDHQPGKTEASSKDSTSLVKRGEYLVLTTGCDDCHSPKRMGPRGPELIPELRLSGFQQSDKLPPIDTSEVMKGWSLMAPGQTATLGPWGVSYAANITSDETGIGNWSVEQFINCIRNGKCKGLDGSRPILPPMPWTTLRNMTDDDLKAMYYYLKTTKPVPNIVPSAKALHELK